MIPRSAKVTLKIYNILGQEVATLISDNLKTETYRVHWDAGNQASGIYIYQLTVDNYSKTGKMLLVK